MNVEYPSAEVIGAVIVAAARETGENAVACLNRVARLRCRHYALHALMHAYPDLARPAAARMVGAPSHGAAFFYNSYHQTFRRKTDGARASQWWNEDAFRRVIEAAAAAGAPQHEYEPFRLVKFLDLRRKPRADALDMTAEMMGDPAPGRSALAKRDGA